MENARQAASGDTPDDEKVTMKMITDARSAKVSEIAHQPRGEIVWWFHRTSEQYRFAGKLELVTADAVGYLQEVRQQMWRKMSEPARQQFFWNQPGLPYEGLPLVPGCGDDHPAPAPDTFLLMTLQPETVKYLRLKDNMSLVDELSAAETGEMGWKCSRVNP